jgi:hypothetical protein
VAERPILFSGPLVRSILDGRKTETRRLVTKGTSQVSDVVGEQAPWCGLADASRAGTSILLVGSGVDGHFIDCRIQPGDALWVRESWQPIGGNIYGPAGVMVRYSADGHPRDCTGTSDAWRVARMKKYGLHWTRVGGQHKGEWPSIHMPRWASRISLRVTDVRAERVQEITGASAQAEGVSLPDPGRTVVMPRSAIDDLYVGKFEELWDQINGKRDGAAWADDPWVWVIKFEVAEVKR